VIDSSSTDGTAELANELGIAVEVIPKHEFNHGLTREKARQLLNVDIVVMMTPDAYAQENLLEQLIQPILDQKASIAYARQIPHNPSSFFEAFPREFNYPKNSHIRSIEDKNEYGAYLYFCSDSCAAYSMKALDSIGGFKKVVLGEDTLAAAQLLHKGHRIAYVAEAVVCHSHSYTLKQEFKRYYDTGLARAQYRQFIGEAALDASRGREFVRAMFKKLIKEKPYLIPYAVLNTAAKWLGYTMGLKRQSSSGV
jgi:rhamnosyltransferase